MILLRQSWINIWPVTFAITIVAASKCMNVVFYHLSDIFAKNCRIGHNMVIIVRYTIV